MPAVPPLCMKETKSNYISSFAIFSHLNKQLSHLNLQASNSQPHYEGFCVFSFGSTCLSMLLLEPDRYWMFGADSDIGE